MRFLAIVFLVLLGHLGYSQVVQVNPNIKWRYIRSQEISFAEGRTYEFEFPAESGFDYMINITHKQPGTYPKMQVHSLQYEPVGIKKDTIGGLSTDLHMQVKDDGTYVLALKLDNNKMEGKMIPCQLTIVRREIVE